jgi:hypothetical protein
MLPEAENAIADWQQSNWQCQTFFSEHGFISYKQYSDSVFLANFFVEKEFRGKGKGAELFHDFRVMIASEFPEIEFIYGDIALNLPGATEKMKKYIFYGANIWMANPEKIIMRYDIIRKKL